MFQEFHDLPVTGGDGDASFSDSDSEDQGIVAKTVVDDFELKVIDNWKFQIFNR